MIRPGFLKNTALVILTMLILFICQSADADGQIYQYGKFVPDAVVRLFSDRVNLRSEPSTKANVVATLPIGSELTVIGEPFENYSASGFSAPWYKVKSAAQPSVEGYVWGGLLSIVSLNFEDSGKKLALIAGITGLADYNFAGECRVLSEGKIVAKVPFKWIATLMNAEKNYFYSAKIEELPWKGTQDIRRVFQIFCGYDACGYTRGNMLFFWTGSEIITGPTAEEVSEAGVFHVESVFVFPGDEGLGEKSLLLRTITSEEADSENGVAASVKKVETLYTWNGKAWEAGKPVETALPVVPSGQGNDAAGKSEKDGGEDAGEAGDSDAAEN